MPFSTEDTIVAIATPEGRGGIGVVRLSGPDAARVAIALSRHQVFQPRYATLVRIDCADVSDRAIVTFFPAPASYTGEDVVEISAHGSPVLLHAIVGEAMKAGARLAEPGEFTLRGYLHGRMDLIQAEAVQDLVAAVTPLQARSAFDQLEGTLTARIAALDTALFDLSTRLEASLDFAGEGYHFVDRAQVASEIGGVIASLDALLRDAGAGRLVREGAQVVILGRPNAGKSTLFNALLGADRAIVTDVAGTTRDLLSERVEIGGINVTLVDTAGIRHSTNDPVEREGIYRATSASKSAALALVLLDRSRPLEAEDRALLESTVPARRLMVLSKADLPSAWVDPSIRDGAVEISAPLGIGVETLRRQIAAGLGLNELHRDTPTLTNVRHVGLLARARVALDRSREAAAAGLPEELIAADCAEARAAFEEVTGHRTPDDTLHAIFDRFCIGK
ncbi:MAG: tRNA uridine-5-carboxymethylaminomethyl(34) synthesis GTPase MnmE [Acidobacteria bacterium]|nr:tRNA uridine-5-carboxymethylaminomethyl(34) synthesis GTPase MnmE [Acidobacteriota bacterium]